MRPTRLLSAKSTNSKLSKGSKTFYPEGYFKRVGYEMSEKSHQSHYRIDALGQRVRNRFNENVDAKSI